MVDMDMVGVFNPEDMGMDAEDGDDIFVILG